MRPSITTTPIPENKWGLRHIIGIMGFLVTALADIHRFCLSLAITEMTGEFDWDEETQGLILSSFFWGYVIITIPGGMMAERWGVKWVLGCGMFVSTFGTLITPLISRTFGSWGLICLRIFIGIGQGPLYPSLNVLMSNWSPINERARLGALVYSGAYVGNFLSMAVSGLIIYYLGWTAVFYILGGIGVVWLIFWMIVYHNTPLEHPFIKEDERSHIITTSGKTCYKSLPPTPWIPILTSIPLWGMIIVHFGHGWGLCTITTDLPKYMKSVLHVSVEENGAISGLPHLGMWLFAIASGWVIDLMIVEFRWRASLVRKIFVTIASVGPAVGIIAASYSGCDKPLAIVFFAFGMAIMGAYVTPLRINVLDLSPNYAGTVMALVGAVGSISGILSPYITGVITPNGTLLEWRLVFWIAFAVILVTNIAFLIMATASTQWWNDPDQVQSYIEGKEKETA